jgi:hypothetical protein
MFGAVFGVGFFALRLFAAWLLVSQFGWYALFLAAVTFLSFRVLTAK